MVDGPIGSIHSGSEIIVMEDWSELIYSVRACDYTCSSVLTFIMFLIFCKAQCRTTTRSTKNTKKVGKLFPRLIQRVILLSPYLLYVTLGQEYHLLLRTAGHFYFTRDTASIQMLLNHSFFSMRNLATGVEFSWLDRSLPKYCYATNPKPRWGCWIDIRSDIL